MIDVDSLTDAEAQELLEALHRRQTLRAAESQIVSAQNDYLIARDGEVPFDLTQATVESWPEFQTPQGVVGSYPAGYVIRQGEDLFKARRNGVAHSPSAAAEEWQQVWLVEGELSEEPPNNPDTGVPEYPTYDPTKTYYRNPNDSPQIIVKHDGKLWVLIHSTAAPNYVPGGAGMHAVWATYTP